MKKIKIMMIVVVIIIIAIIVTLMCIYKNPTIIDSPASNSGVDREINDKLIRVKDKIVFYAVKACVNKYYMCFGTQVPEEQSLINMLDAEYINSKQITINNVLENLPKYTEELEVTISDMYVNDKTERISAYVVSGDLRGKSSNTISKFKVIIKLDKINKAFKILPQSYVEEKYISLENGNSIKIDVPEEITKNMDNIYEIKNINEETYTTDLFNRYKNELIYNRELAYQELDKEYSKAKFSNFNEYDTYVKNNIRNIALGKLDKYQKTIENGYTQYVLVDTKRKKLHF